MIGEEARARMRAAAAKYPSARSATLTALHIAQEEEGYITPEGVDAVAETLGMRADEVDSVVSFYSMYFRKPVGRHVIKVCTSISCYLRGCDQLLAHLEQRLGIARGATTPDGVFTLLPIECLASCGTAPVLQVNDEFVENVSLERADALIAQLRQRAPEGVHPYAPTQVTSEMQGGQPISGEQPIADPSPAPSAPPDAAGSGNINGEEPHA